MGYHDRLKQVEEIRQRLESLGPLTEDARKKLNYRFRLDMNYHSNRMEGGTLTVAETKSVMAGVITVEGKPIRDVLEMEGHDRIVQELLAMGRGEKRISERRIRDIHQAIILPDPDQPEEIPGRWKKVPNEILTYRGEKVTFAAPGDVPELIHKLLDKVNAELERLERGEGEGKHPLLIAADFQVEYLTIHPFWDGNGRTARILSNLILVSRGYPPIVVPTEQKTTYNQLLSDLQTFGGDRAPFYSFLANRLLHSMELVDRVLNGGDISEPDDLDKRLQLMDLELKAVDPENEIRETLDYEYLIKVLDTWGGDLLSSMIVTTQKFNKYYRERNHRVEILGTPVAYSFDEDSSQEILEGIKANLLSTYDYFLGTTGYRINFMAHYEKFSLGGFNTFGCIYRASIILGELKYSVEVNVWDESEIYASSNVMFTKLLHQPLSTEEIKQIDQAFGEVLFAHLDYHTKQAGIR